MGSKPQRESHCPFIPLVSDWHTSHPPALTDSSSQMSPPSSLLKPFHPKPCSPWFVWPLGTAYADGFAFTCLSVMTSPYESRTCFKKVNKDMCASAPPLVPFTFYLSGSISCHPLHLNLVPFFSSLSTAIFLFSPSEFCVPRNSRKGGLTSKTFLTNVSGH